MTEEQKAVSSANDAAQSQSAASEAALEAMGRLRGEGFTFRVLLSRGASGLLDVERLRSVLEPEKLWVETPEETPEALTARYDTILVPAMTVHTAAHVAA